MQRMLDLSAPIGAVLQMWPKGHVTQGYCYYLMYDSSGETLVKEWLMKLLEEFERQAKVQPPPPVVQPTEVLTKGQETVMIPPLTEDDKLLCSCGHIKRVHVQLQGECCEGVCNCVAFNAG